MPLPFILGAAGAAIAGAVGIGGHLSAKETNEKAQKRSNEAQRIYNEEKSVLEKAQNVTKESLLKLGYDKKQALEVDLKNFFDAYDKVKHIAVNYTEGMNELSSFKLDEQDEIEIRKLTDIYSSSIKSVATGAAAGAVIALAASGTLPIVTGGLDIAGSMFMAGEFSAAAGIAGSALSFGAAMTPLAAIAAPVVLFTGISASIKADENLEKADTMYAEAEAAVEKMKVSEVLCDAISTKSDMYDELLNNLLKMFSPCVALLVALVKKKEGRFFKKRLTKEDFTDQELQLIGVTRSLAGTIKAVIDMPLLNDDGSFVEKSEKIYENSVSELPDFKCKTDMVMSYDYGVKPVSLSAGRLAYGSGKVASGAAIVGNTKGILSIIAGLVAALILSGKLAAVITNSPGKFLFLKAYTANKIALFMLIAFTIIMFAGQFKDKLISKICIYGTCISMLILYVQFCRSLQKMEHYIIFSIICVIVLGKLIYYLYDAEVYDYLKMMLKYLISWPVGFVIYRCISYNIGLSNTFCIVVTSIMVLIWLVCIALYTYYNDYYYT